MAKHQAPSTKHQAPSTKHLLLLTFLLFAVFFNVKSQDAPSNPIILGAQLANPYSKAAMQAALSILQVKKPNLDYDLLPAIATTHYYVRYKPNNDEELDILRSDETIEWFDYPLDYEILDGNGTWYHDPDIPINEITWQYCVIEKNTPLKSVYYEVLAELLLAESFIENDNTNPALDSLVMDWVNESFLNLEYLDQGLGSRASKWFPSGTITVYDDLMGSQIPLKGAKVRVRNWFKVRTGYTNSNGQFITAAFRNKVNYKIKWESSKFDIRNEWNIQEYFKGTENTKNAWNASISSGTTLRHATIHRAAYRYFHDDIGGLKRPNIWTKLKINYIDKSGANQGINWGNHWQVYVLGPVLPNIKIWKNNGGSDFDTDEIFATTVHEIGHTSHIQLMNTVGQYGLVDKLIRESWANAIEWHITDIEYSNLGHGSVGKYTEQGWNSSSNDIEYSPLFIDFVDNQNQGVNIITGIPYCDIGQMDAGGVNCQIGKPPAGETAFIYTGGSGTKYFYHTPVGANGCPLYNAYFDGANCQVLVIPPGRTPFIYSNNMYIDPVISTVTTRISNKPDDAITGYNMGNIESQIVKHSLGLNSLQTQLKANKPSGVTNTQIDTYLNFYFNL